MKPGTKFGLVLVAIFWVAAGTLIYLASPYFGLGCLFAVLTIVWIIGISGWASRPFSDDLRIPFCAAIGGTLCGASVFCFLSAIMNLITRAAK